jgi:hypothetical protein
MTTEKVIATKYSSLAGLLSERARRVWAATEALAIGRGGRAVVSRATGLSRTTIRVGISELEEMKAGRGLPPERVRNSGGGPKTLVEKQEGLQEALEALVAPVTRGDPMSALRWTSKSTRILATELCAQGFQISAGTVATLLKVAGYSLQAPRKTKEGGKHPDRNAQFEFINTETQRFANDGNPVISVDTKKKELVGDFVNRGREWHPHGTSPEVRVYDFIDKKLGKAIPYGVYDVLANEGWVSVGIDHDTAEFAVETINRWWKEMGRATYPNATQLMITADCGGSNSYRTRLWKTELQRLADQTGLTISVRHLPPGTSKWNKIEHRMFAHITRNWRGRPLESLQVIVELIAATRTQAGLSINAVLDSGTYPAGQKVTDEQLEAVNLVRHTKREAWNYSVLPNSTTV